jgi:hypothetical protein
LKEEGVFFETVHVFSSPSRQFFSASYSLLSLSLPYLPPFVAGAFSSTYHPDWSVLAARIVVSDLHKQTESKFSKNAALLHSHVHPKTGAPSPLIADDVFEIIQKNAEKIDAAMHYERDFE